MQATKELHEKVAKAAEALLVKVGPHGDHEIFDLFAGAGDNASETLREQGIRDFSLDDPRWFQLWLASLESNLCDASPKAQAWYKKHFNIFG